MSESAKPQIFEPLSLIKFQPAIEICSEMKSYHQQNHGENQTQNPPKIEDILNSIIPPRDWNDSLDKLYIQYVSHQPASREDVIQLRERLEKVLQDRQARSIGVCPIREQLYSQAFDQIIRQVAVDCSERGLLLMRVRDQHKMTLSAYQTIYQASVSFGLKKQIQSEDGVEEFESQIKELQRRQSQLQSKRDLLICQKDLLQRQIREKNMNAVNRREEQLKFLEMQTENLTKFLDSVRHELC